jgi:phosphatidylserine decarboxylase
MITTMIWALKWVPRKSMSRVVGWFMHLRGPRILNTLSIRAFAWFYNINVDEAELAMEHYHSIGHFFTRRLKPGARPIANTWAVHPCDSLIIQHGPIEEGVLIQAKGQRFRLVELTEDPQAMEKYGDGFFLTYYLCPTDYHRVHSPVHGYIRSVMYRNGDLWPVNMSSVKSVPKLYVVNERLMTEIATEFGPVGVVMVGATNVGSMSLAFDPNIRTNRNVKSKRHTYETPIEINKGDELGIFHMGSTVILLLSKEFREKYGRDLNLSDHVKIGQPLIKQHS